jgi:hypothetical protein
MHGTHNVRLVRFLYGTG